MQVSTVHHNHTRGSLVTLVTLHARVELAGHNGHAPDVLGDGECEGGPSLSLGFRSERRLGLGSGRESLLSCRALR